MGESIFVLKPVELIDNAEEARDFAIEWQGWASDRDLSYGELVDYADYFERLGKRFNLTDEFKENGILQGAKVNIAIKEREATYILSEDFEFLCSHENVEVEAPCCNGRDCGCYGLYSVYCYNEDCTGLEQWQVDEIIDNYLSNLERDYDD